MSLHIFNRLVVNPALVVSISASPNDESRAVIALAGADSLYTDWDSAEQLRDHLALTSAKRHTTAKARKDRGIIYD